MEDPRLEEEVDELPTRLDAVENPLALGARKHGKAPRESGWLDPYSSARAFDGWRGIDRGQLTATASVARPATWLLAIGWRRGGLIDPDHCPGVMPA